MLKSKKCIHLCDYEGATAANIGGELKVLKRMRKTLRVK